MKLTSAEINKNYRERNPERWLASLRKYQKKKWLCPCGLTVINQCRPNHLKTKTHASRMKLIESLNAFPKANQKGSEENNNNNDI